MLCDHLAPKVLDLGGQPLPDCIALLSHDVPPYCIEFVQDLRDGRLCHGTFEIVSDFKNSSDGLGRDPVVVDLCLLRLAHLGVREGSLSLAGSLHYLSIAVISILTSLLKELHQLFVITLQASNLDL